MKLLQGDCLDILKTLENNSIDAIVTDPPYELGFMGKSWDNTGIANNQEMWKECLRVLKPGGHLLAFSGTRTYHRMACAIEDAGFEVRDMIEWVYGSGFPKSLNIGKQLDRMNGVDNIQHKGKWNFEHGNMEEFYRRKKEYKKEDDKPLQTEQAKQWEGWGTALKPSHEPVVFCSKPLTPRLYFAILIGDISNNIIQLCQISNVKNAEKISLDFQAKLEKEGVLSVADNVKMNAWESLENVKFAEQSSISSEQKSSDLTKTKESSAQLNVKQSGNEDKTQEIKILAGVEENIKALMDIIIFGTMEDTSQNIALLWNNISEDLLNQANTLTISMATRLITDLKILKLSATQSILESTGSLFKTPQNIPPKHEPICMARKPLAEKTIAENVLKYGTGGINIDESRVDYHSEADKASATPQGKCTSNTSAGSAPDVDMSEVDYHGEKYWYKNEYKWLIDKWLNDEDYVWSELKENLETYDWCKVPDIDDGDRVLFDSAEGVCIRLYESKRKEFDRPEQLGRFPANLIHDNSEEVRECFPETNPSKSASRGLQHSGRHGGLADIGHNIKEGTDTVRGHDDNGGNASRFFKSIIYTAKSSKSERNKGCEEVGGNKHCTVKPIALMEYLIKMITPKGGIVLDPFMGSGSTGIACKKLNRHFIGIEREPDYITIAENRIEAVPKTLF